MTFEELLSRAAEPTLQTLIGRPGVRLLSRLDPAHTSAEGLRQIALGLQSPAEMLLDLDTRRELLPLLPRTEAASLATELGLDDADPYAALDALRLRPGSERTYVLLGHFGVEEPDIPTIEIGPSLEQISPEHGLFPHQRLAAQRVLRALGEGPRRVLLHMPTGAGKTRTAMNVIARLMNTSEPLLAVWLAHSEELCEQAAEEFQSSWAFLGNREVSIHRWWGPYELDASQLSDGLLVAGLSKAYSSALKETATIGQIAGRVGLVVMDEAHQAVAPTYQHILEMLTEAGQLTPLLGLTATPGRTWNDIDEDELLADFFHRQLVQLEVAGYDSPVTYLIDNGYLARTTFESLTHTGGIDLSDADLRDIAAHLDIPQRVVRELAEDERRNMAVLTRVEQMAEDHRRIILFAATVDHARLLATVLRARGIRAAVITGDTPSHERARIIADFRLDSLEPQVLVNFGVLTAGFDAPKTSATLIARPTTSLVLYSQMVGRATRGPRAGGNENAEVVTVVDTALPGFASMTEAFHNWEDIWRQNP
jgi:DNA repair protein RadD